jgi:undecaprenyl-diphosphatase
MEGLRVGTLVGWDQSVFLFLNGRLIHPILDHVMPVITNADYWRVPLGIAWLLLVVFGGKKGRIVALLAAVTLTFSDQISSALIKPLVGRVRPCYALEQVRLLIQQTDSPSFPSSHAANMTAMAVLFSIHYRRLWGVFVCLAVLVSYSRIYVGVHYPLDVMAGALVGLFSAGFALAGAKGVVFIWHIWKRSRGGVDSEAGDKNREKGETHEEADR